MPVIPTSIFLLLTLLRLQLASLTRCKYYMRFESLMIACEVDYGIEIPPRLYTVIYIERTIVSPDLMPVLK